MLSFRNVAIAAVLVAAVWFGWIELQHRAGRLKMLEQAGRVGMSEGALEAVAEGLRRQGTAKPRAYEIVWLLACTGVPTAANFAALANVAAALGDVPARKAVLDVLDLRSTEATAFNGCV